MVSPSKVQHQKQKSLLKDPKNEHKSHVRLQKGDKPLSKKAFYLDIKNHGISSKLETRIKDLGGVVEVFLGKSVTLVVSDRIEKSNPTNCDKRKWAYASGGSGGPPSLRSIEVQTPIRTPPTPSLNGECPLSNSTNTRGQTGLRTKSRVDAMLERALTQPQKCSVDPLDNAQNWGIPIWTTDKLQAWLDKIYLSLRDSGNLKCTNRSEKDLRVKNFKKSYIKFESFKRETRPVFLELPVWPTLNFDGEPGTCPFDRKKKEERKKANNEKKETKEEMTRRPRATATTRARRSEQLVAGYCEICRIDYKDFTKHVQSDKHLAFVRNDHNFLSLDTLINSGASVEAFLKLNQPDDVGQDIYTNGNDDLHGVVISRDNVDKTVNSELTSFSVDELKMVQCNGARRKLNLKLSSPHNLRTRAKHESGHLLRSKGSPWHEVEKSEKLYEKLDGYTIKKRSKGTIWIEEDDSASKSEDDEADDDDDDDNVDGGGSDHHDNDESKIIKSGIVEEKLTKSLKSGIAEEKVTKSVKSGIFEERATKNVKSGIVEEKATKNVKSGIVEERATKNVKSGIVEEKPTKNAKSGTVEEKVTKSLKSGIAEDKVAKNVKSGIVEEKTTKNVKSGIVEEKVTKSLTSGITEEKAAKNVRSGIGEENSPLTELNDVRLKNKESRSQNQKKNQSLSRADEKRDRKKIEPDVDPKKSLVENGTKEDEVCEESEITKNTSEECNARIASETNGKSPGDERKSPMSSKSIPSNLTINNHVSTEKPVSVEKNNETEVVNDEVVLEVEDNQPEKSSKANKPPESEKKDEKSKLCRINRRGMRSARVRQRLSVEERLIEDNRAYYKVEVLGNKLRSSNTPWSNNRPVQPPEKPPENDVKNDEGPSSEKPVVVRFKRVRKSELSLLSDEAESFMFGDSRRDESTESQDEGSSVLPRDTESEAGKSSSSIIISAATSSPVKIEQVDSDSQDSTYMGRARKRRRTQAEVFIRDNADYYKFETPGSRLRFQGSNSGKEDMLGEQNAEINLELNESAKATAEPNSELGGEKKDEGEACVEKLYPSKPSAEIEKMHFSFESIPKSEPWYQTYQRQDEGAEFWHYFSESDAKKPFLLPYEIENFHEHLRSICQKNEARKKARFRGLNGFGRSPRKSPRCHASTLAIMSTIIRKREQQPPVNSSTIEEEPQSRTNTPKPEKSSTDFELLQIVRSIDDMLNAEPPPNDSFEPDSMAKIDYEIDDEEEEEEEEEIHISGPPENLLDLLENCHQHVNGFENSSCASSECGEAVAESPMKRRKRRKNRTGWPGNKIRKRLQIKQRTLPDVDSERENLPAKIHCNEDGVGEDYERFDVEEEEDEEKTNRQGIRERLQGSVRESQESRTAKCKVSLDLPECQSSKCEEDKSSIDENHENRFRQEGLNTSAAIKQMTTKLPSQRRQRDLETRPSSSEMNDSHPEIENSDGIYRKKTTSTIISRKNYTTVNLSSKRRRETNGRDSCSSDPHGVETNAVEGQRESPCKKDSPKKPIKSRRRQGKSSSASLNFEDENCKKDSLDSELECERVNPPSSEIRQRRSSMEFQPVVRVMKIDDQVDIDHNILSVTVASNRRLRSSSSPRSHASPPSKRFKRSAERSRGPLGRWAKNS